MYIHTQNPRILYIILCAFIAHLYRTLIHIFIYKFMRIYAYFVNAYFMHILFILTPFYA